MTTTKSTRDKLKIVKNGGGVIPHGKTLADVSSEFMLNLPDVAKMLKCTPITLRRYKNRKGMPPYYKIPAIKGWQGRIFYDKRDVIQWLEKYKVITQ